MLKAYIARLKDVREPWIMEPILAPEPLRFLFIIKLAIFVTGRYLGTSCLDLSSLVIRFMCVRCVGLRIKPGKNFSLVERDILFEEAVISILSKSLNMVLAS